MPLEARERALAARVAEAPVPELFAELARRVAAAEDPNEVVDEFHAEHPRSPIVEGECTAHLFFRGPAQDLVVRGDFLADEEELPLRRVPGTDLFHATLELEPDARIGYQLVRTHDYERLDPFLASLEELRDVDLLEAPRLAAAVSESKAFATFLGELQKRISERKELQGVAFDRQTAGEMLKVYLGR